MAAPPTLSGRYWSHLCPHGIQKQRKAEQDLAKKHEENYADLKRKYASIKDNKDLELLRRAYNLARDNWNVGSLHYAMEDMNHHAHGQLLVCPLVSQGCSMTKFFVGRWVQHSLMYEIMQPTASVFMGWLQVCSSTQVDVWKVPQMDKGNPLKPTHFELQFVDQLVKSILVKVRVKYQVVKFWTSFHITLSRHIGSSESVRHHRFCGKLQSFGSSLCFIVLKTQTAPSCELSLVHHRWAVITQSLNQGRVVH